MTDEEYRFGAAVRRTLDSRARDIDPAVLTRLKASRQLALSSQRVGGLHLAGLHGSFGVESLWPQARAAAAISALVLGLIGTYYWNAFEDADENAEIDSALLADDLPVAAYSDQGFHAWLERSSPSSP